MGRVGGRVLMTKTQRWRERAGNRTECRGMPSSFDANIFALPVQIYNVQTNQSNASVFFHLPRRLIRTMRNFRKWIKGYNIRKQTNKNVT